MAGFYPDVEAVVARFPELAPIVAQHRVQAVAHLPLRRGSEVFGVLSVRYAAPRSWDDDERAFAQALADRAAIAYERARLAEAEGKARARAEQLQSLATALSRAATPAAVYAAVLAAGISVQTVDERTVAANVVTLYRCADDALTLIGYNGAVLARVDPPQTIALATPLPATDVARSKVPLFVSSRASLVRAYPHLAARAETAGMEALVGLPLLVEEHVLGVLTVTFAGPVLFEAGEREFLLAIGSLVAQALERSRLFTIAQSSQMRFATLFQAAPFGMVLSAPPDYRIVDVNDALLALFGFERDEVLGRSEQELGIVHDPAARDELARLMQTEQAVRDYRYTSHTPSGEQIELSLSIRVVEVAGEPHVLTVVHDITEQTRTLAALQQSEERMRLAMEANAMVAWSWEVASNRITTSDNFAAIYGVPALSGAEAGFALVWPEDLVTHQPRVLHVAQHGGSYRSSYRITRPTDGQVVWFEEHAAALTDEQGRVERLVGVVMDVTARKLAEEGLARAQTELADQAAFYDTILSTVKDYVYAFDRDGRFLYANQRLLELWGLPRETAIGKTLAALNYSKPVEERLLEGVAAVYASGQTVVNETFYTAPDGQSGFYENLLSPVMADGQVAFVAGSSRDISERRQRERDAAFVDELSQELMRPLSERKLLRSAAARIGRYLRLSRCHFSEYDLAADRASVHVDWSVDERPSLRGTSYPVSPFLGPAVASLAQGEQLVVADVATDLPNPATAAQFIAGGIAAMVLTPFLSGGRWTAALTVYDHSPRAWRAAELELLRVLTSRIWARVERGRAERALRESEARLRLATEAAGMFAWECDFRRGTISWSENAAALIGCTPEELPAALDGSHFFVLPEDSARVNQEYAALLARGERRYRFEFRGGWPPEQGRIWQAVGAVECDEAGAPVHSFGITQDITERKRAEAALLAAMEREQALRKEAEEASRLKDEFLATVSHELRTPLTALLGYAELLQRRKRDEAYVARTVEKIRRSAETQAQLVEDLLDVSRIVSGRLRIASEQIDLRDVIDAALDTVRPAIEAKQQRLELILAPGASEVIGDTNRLQQVIWNLLANAAKFTPAGGTIAVELRRNQGSAEIVVADSGQGIAADFLPFVFERFRQADSSSQRVYGGLGLGLAIARHLVELHGGTISAHSAGVGQGATFVVQLPLAHTDQVGAGATLAAVATLEPQRDEPQPLAGLRVVVVDDQPSILELVAELLELAGAAVVACSSGPEALALIQQQRPDVLVSDIAMPGEDGYWLIEQLRALPEQAGGATPAVALTAYVRIEDRLRVLASGFQLYVPKPVEADELIAAVVTLARDGSGSAA